MVTMSVRISCVCIDAVKPRVVAGFRAAVLRWDVVEDCDEYISLTSPSRDLPTLDIVPVPAAKLVKTDCTSTCGLTGPPFDAEVDRPEALGARRVAVGQARDLGGLRRPRGQ